MEGAMFIAAARDGEFKLSFTEMSDAEWWVRA